MSTKNGFCEICTKEGEKDKNNKYRKSNFLIKLFWNLPYIYYNENNKIYNTLFSIIQSLIGLRYFFGWIFKIGKEWHVQKFFSYYNIHGIHVYVYACIHIYVYMYMHTIGTYTTSLLQYYTLITLCFLYKFNRLFCL